RPMAIAYERCALLWPLACGLPPFDLETSRPGAEALALDAVAIAALKRVLRAQQRDLPDALFADLQNSRVHGGRADRRVVRVDVRAPHTGVRSDNFDEQARVRLSAQHRQRPQVQPIGRRHLQDRRRARFALDLEAATVAG